MHVSLVKKSQVIIHLHPWILAFKAQAHALLDPESTGGANALQLVLGCLPQQFHAQYVHSLGSRTLYQAATTNGATQVCHRRALVDGFKCGLPLCMRWVPRRCTRPQQ